MSTVFEHYPLFLVFVCILTNTAVPHLGVTLTAWQGSRQDVMFDLINLHVVQCRLDSKWWRYDWQGSWPACPVFLLHSSSYMLDWQIKYDFDYDINTARILLWSLLVIWVNIFWQNIKYEHFVCWPIITNSIMLMTKIGRDNIRMGGTHSELQEMP